MKPLKNRGKLTFFVLEHVRVLLSDEQTTIALIDPVILKKKTYINVFKAQLIDSGLEFRFADQWLCFENFMVDWIKTKAV